jgi:hypothetical protein
MNGHQEGRENEISWIVNALKKILYLTQLLRFIFRNCTIRKEIGEVVLVHLFACFILKGLDQILILFDCLSTQYDASSGFEWSK